MDARTVRHSAPLLVSRAEARALAELPEERQFPTDLALLQEALREALEDDPQFLDLLDL
jgi:hypothetical protein